MPFAFESNKDRLLMIREPNHDELIGLSNGNDIYQDLANDEKLYWSTPFSIDDVEDF
jgi:hypothetical protein